MQFKAGPPNPYKPVPGTLLYVISKIGSRRDRYEEKTSIQILQADFFSSVTISLAKALEDPE
jgi:hypothetical protein